jgi:MarR family transcriptional regulator, organic hydroperoxide resistance regulator
MPDCRVLDVTDALFITVGGTRKLVDKIEANGCRQDRSQRMVQAATESHRRPLEPNRLTASGQALLQEANVTFTEALADYIGAAAPASDLNQLSSTLRRLRRHLMITAYRARPAGRQQAWTRSTSKEEQS